MSCAAEWEIARWAPGDYILDAGGLGLRLLNCNFSASGTNGITITASNVHLSLNNSRLMFVAVAGATPGYGILVRAADGTSRLSNVTIRGAGAVVGFNVGIKFEKVDRSSIDGVTAANNRASGIETDDVTRFRLTESMMARNGTYGLKLRNSVEGRIRGNTMSADGIRTTFSAGTTTVIWPATAPGIGIGIHGGSDNSVHRNTVAGNFGNGIAMPWISPGARRPDGQARRPRIAGLSEGGATPPAGMPRPGIM